MKTEIGIIILNYMCWEATVKCVKCFQQHFADPKVSDPENSLRVQIIIVDNASSNDSYARLISEYKDNDIVHVLKTHKNIGYARGNNFGYQYLKMLMNANFVIVSNDDAYAETEGLLPWIFEMYEKHGFGVLGPSVLSMRSGLHQSPWSDDMDCFEHLVSRYIRNMNKDCNLVKKRKEDNLKYQEFHDDMILSGSFLIFSEKYLVKYNELFNPRTFLYAEENLLKIRCNKYNLKMIYDPSYEINHEESASFYEGKTEEEVFATKDRYHREAMNIYDRELWKLKDYYFLRRLLDLLYIRREIRKGHEYVFPSIKSLKKTKIVIYGAGKIGTALYDQCMKDKYFMVSGWVDRDKRSDIVRDPLFILQIDFDYIFIAINDKIIAQKVKRELQKQGIPEHKIKWIKGYKIKRN